MAGQGPLGAESGRGPAGDRWIFWVSELPASLCIWAGGFSSDTVSSFMRLREEREEIDIMQGKQRLAPSRASITEEQWLVLVIP